MRIPWPSQLNMKTVLYFGLALLVVQLLLGTSPLFAVGIFYFVMVTAIAFNIAGGMNTYSGSYVAFMALETILISQIAKVFYLQAADSHLVTPMTTIAVYDMGITAIALAVIISRKYQRKKRPIFNADNDGDRLVGMSIASSLMGIFSLLLVGLYGFSEDLSVQHGGLYGFLNQFGGFLPLGILLGTAYIIQQSRGTRSARWWTIIPLALLTLDGIALQSKQGIFQPVLMWLLVCAAYGYKLNRKQVIALICGAGFAAYIIFPVVQYMRGYTRTGDLFNRGKLVYEYLSDNSLLSIRDAYLANEELKEEGSATGYFYYGTDKEVLDRISLIEMEDAIIYRTEASMPRGMQPLEDGFLSMVPRLIWANKDQWQTGKVAQVNEMGREIGLLAPTDESTYISFSMFGSTFYMVGWAMGPLLLVIMTPLFFIMDSFYGNVKTNMFCLFAVLGNIHGAPEFTLAAVTAGLVHAIPLTGMTIVFVRFVSPTITIFLGNRGMLDRQTIAAPAPTLATAARA